MSNNPHSLVLCEFWLVLLGGQSLYTIVYSSRSSRISLQSSSRSVWTQETFAKYYATQTENVFCKSVTRSLQTRATQKQKSSSRELLWGHIPSVPREQLKGCAKCRDRTETTLFRVHREIAIRQKDWAMSCWTDLSSKFQQLWTDKGFSWVYNV